MQLRGILFAATMLALPMAVQAGETVNGVYVGAGGGFNLLNSLSVSNFGVYDRDGSADVGPLSPGNLSSDGGWAVLGSVGYGLGNGVRVEIEGNFRQNSVHLSNSFGSGSGQWQQAGVMVNALYDFTTVAPWVTPYVGIGFGYIWNTFSGGDVAFTTNAGHRHQRDWNIDFSNNTEGAGAGQFILGAAFPLGVPGLSLTTEFRFIGEFGNSTFNGSPTVTSTHYGNYSQEGGGHSHSHAGDHTASATIGTPTNESFLIGLRYAFNSAPPPPPPAPIAAPAPAPARTYLVFFDWDHADLTARSRAIIAEAAQASTRVQLTQIEVSGYADRTGTAQYNVALSRRRADNVAAELVRLGVPQNEIFIQAFGDTHLLVPTGPGVREPQNRRVEIVLK